MGKCGLSDFKSKNEGDTVYSTDMPHCGREGTVLEGTPDDRPVGTILVRWHDDGSERRVSSTRVTKKIEEWDEE